MFPHRAGIFNPEDGETQTPVWPAYGEAEKRIDSAWQMG